MCLEHNEMDINVMYVCIHRETGCTHYRDRQRQRDTQTHSERERESVERDIKINI